MTSISKTEQIDRKLIKNEGYIPVHIPLIHNSNAEITLCFTSC